MGKTKVCYNLIDRAGCTLSIFRKFHQSLKVTDPDLCFAQIPVVHAYINKQSICVPVV